MFLKNRKIDALKRYYDIDEKNPDELVETAAVSSVSKHRET